MTRPPARVDAVIVGAGQAGLTMSWHLRRAGRDHVLLDRRATLGGRWQDRWDRFRLVSPNWTASFPGAPYPGSDPADLGANLAFADGFFEERFRKLIDAFIVASGMDCPAAEPTATIAFEPKVIEELDLASAGILTVLWATGYQQDFGWIEPPITDEMGFARQVRGVTEIPGLYLIGSLWQHDQSRPPCSASAAMLASWPSVWASAPPTTTTSAAPEHAVRTSRDPARIARDVALPPERRAATASVA